MDDKVMLCVLQECCAEALLGLCRLEPKLMEHINERISISSPAGGPGWHAV